VIAKSLQMHYDVSVTPKALTSAVGSSDASSIHFYSFSKMPTAKKNGADLKTATLSDVLTIIANASVDGSNGSYIDLRDQCERFQARPDIVKKAIDKAFDIEAQRQQRRAETPAGEKANLAGLGIPALAIPLKALLNDPVAGLAYQAMTTAIPAETPLYEIKKLEGKDSVQGFTLRVMAGEADGVATPVLVAPDDSVIDDVEFLAHQIGNGGHCYVRVGPTIIKVPIAPSDAYLRERRDKGVAATVFDYPVALGLPPLNMVSGLFPDQQIPSLKSAPMEFIHPRDAELVPWKTPLKIEKILGIRTRYDGVRLVVTDPAGNVFTGVLAVEGIRKVCGQKQKTERGGTVNVLTEASIGKRFQIEGASLRTNKDGEVLNGEGDTEAQFKKTCAAGETFTESWDVFISNPDDDFEIDV